MKNSTTDLNGSSTYPLLANLKKYLLLFFLVCSSLSPLLAQDIRIWGDEITSILAEGREKTSLIGNVRIERDAKIILANSAIIEGADNDLITFEGNIRLRDAENEFTLNAEELQFDTNAEVLIGRGTIRMDDEKNNVQLEAQYLRYDENLEKVELQNSIQIVQDDLVVTSQNAVYWKDRQILELSGLPKVVKEESNFEALFIQVNLDNDELVMRGSITGNLIDNQEEDPKKESAKDSKEGSKESSGESPNTEKVDANNSEKPQEGSSAGSSVVGAESEEKKVTQDGTTDKSTDDTTGNTTNDTAEEKEVKPETRREARRRAREEKKKKSSSTTAN